MVRLSAFIIINLHNNNYVGEFGQVYKGYMKTRFKADVVAVKTLKGDY